MRSAFAIIVALLTAPALAQTIPTMADQPGQPDTGTTVAGTYQVDPEHTQVLWEVNHMGLSRLAGMFGASKGRLILDPDDLAATRLEVSFHIEGVSVTSSAFAHHLLADDFFAVAEYPTARFVSTSIAADEDGAATTTGDLTIKNITQEITIDAHFVGAGINPMDEKLHIGFSGAATLQRSDFDLGAYAPGVSDDVSLTINAAFVVQ